MDIKLSRIFMDIEKQNDIKNIEEDIFLEEVDKSFYEYEKKINRELFFTKVFFVFAILTLIIVGWLKILSYI